MARSSFELRSVSLLETHRKENRLQLVHQKARCMYIVLSVSHLLTRRRGGFGKRIDLSEKTYFCCFSCCFSKNSRWICFSRVGRQGLNVLRNSSAFSDSPLQF